MAFAAFTVVHPESHTIRHMCTDYINMCSPKYNSLLSLRCTLSSKQSHVTSEFNASTNLDCIQNIVQQKWECKNRWEIREHEKPLKLHTNFFLTLHIQHKCQQSSSNYCSYREATPSYRSFWFLRFSWWKWSIAKHPCKSMTANSFMWQGAHNLRIEIIQKWHTLKYLQ